LETTRKISIRLKLLFFICLFSISLQGQSKSSSFDNFYREDQFFLGSSYFIQNQSVQDFKQNGFSGNFQIGFIRDIPINNNSSKAIGIGFGYERNFFTSNIQPVLEDDIIKYNVVVSRFLESKNNFNYSSISLPIEFRWRTSTRDQYKFWRIYTGFKIKKNFAIYSNPSYGTELKISDIQDWTNSIYFIGGFNTWNLSLEYDLSPILKDKKTTNGENLDLSFLRLGLIFYLL
tara:strand:- start:17710 stop:18405 length:696 start_codon:yes stop_codon:yes gene_type:complete